MSRLLMRKHYAVLMDRYNSGVEPLENWDTIDVLELLSLAQEELELRAAEHNAEFPSVFDIQEPPF